jgi:hypothetical protein
VSYREVLEGLLARTRRPEKRAQYEAELACPPLPMALAYLWKAYKRMRRRKDHSDMGSVKPVGWPDIDAFVRNSRLDLQPWEIEIIEDLDDLYLAAQSEATTSTNTNNNGEGMP